MKEPYAEGPASHGGPESCDDSREGAGEALTGGSAGEVSSPEINQTQGADAVHRRGRQHGDGRYEASPSKALRGPRPLHARTLLTWEPGDLQAARPGGAEGRAVKGIKTPDDGDARLGGVGRVSSTDEAAEQTRETGGGGGGGKGPGRRERGTADTCRTQSREVSVPSGLDRVRQCAKTEPKLRFTALFHHITPELLEGVFGGLKRNASPGIDGERWEHYAKDLSENIRDLHGRVHRGAYRAKPSRRVYIPKADGRLRPLGVASLEDKLVQGAVVRVLNTIFEVDFSGISYGFRPGRSQHMALDALAYGLTMKKVNWVLDADIRGFFDTIDHGWLMKFVEHRVGDPRILRLIQKWLKAGVIEDGSWSASDGVPQGAAISPLLANLYLHHVFDLWAQQWRRKRARGDMIVVRYADDFIVGFQNEGDAKSFLEALRSRLAQFSLELHPDKTRLIEFGRYAAERRSRRGEGKPETFDFLGFTHISGKDRNGRFQLKRQTIGKRLRAKLQEVREDLRRRMHRSISWQGQWLRSVVQGFYQYHAVPTNFEALRTFRTQVTRAWRATLGRRSQKGRIPWERMGRIAEKWLPRARIKHPWPCERFKARHAV